MYPYKYYQYVNLPKLPEDVLEKTNRNWHEYEKKDSGWKDNIYTWSDSFNTEINQWCKENICSSIYWGFQIIRGDLPLHKDIGTKIKFVYLIDNGGPDVVTEWYDEDQNTLVDSVILEKHRWHILKVDSFHRIQGISSPMVRFSVTGRIF